ncbi:hypothetical protein ACE6H2_026083 [Prunus campanulata]
MDIIPTIPRAPRSRSSLFAPMGDSFLFVTPEAASFFHDVVSKRKFVPKRSYQIDALSSDAWSAASQIFEYYHLHTLNFLSSKFNASVIKEFYSNFPADPKGSNYQIVIRIVPIVLRPSVINRVSNTFLSTISFSYDIASLRTRLVEKEKQIQHLLTLIPSSLNPALGYENPSSTVAEVGTQKDPVTEDSDDSNDFDESTGSLVF